MRKQNTIDRNPGPRSAQAGIALLTAMFALLLLSALAFGMMYMANTETTINSNFRDTQQAYFAARSGIEEVRERMRPGALVADRITPPTTAPTASSGGTIYVVNTTGGLTVQPWIYNNAYADTEFCHENFLSSGVELNPGAGTPCSGSTMVPSTAYSTNTTAASSSYTTAASRMEFKWVRITAKTNSSQVEMAPGISTPTAPSASQYFDTSAASNALICWDAGTTTSGTKNMAMTSNDTTGDQGYMYALPSGQTSCNSYSKPGSYAQQQQVYVVTSLAQTSTGARKMLQAEMARFTPPPIPASLVIDGSLSTPAQYDDLNSQGGSISGVDTSSPSCGGAAGQPAIGVYDTGSIANVVLNRPANDTGNPPGVTNIGATGTNQLGPWGTVAGVQTFVSNLSTAATYNYPAGYAGTVLYGTSASTPAITVVNGDYTFPHNATGYGILIVNGGALNMAGNSTWNGIIIVVGNNSNPTYTQSGGSVVSGSVLVANIANGALVSPVINMNGGGSSGGIQYNSCNVANMGNYAAYRLLSLREMPY